MRIVFLVSLAFLFVSPAFAEDRIIWQSAEPTCGTIYLPSGQSGPKGYATIRQKPDGFKYKRECDYLDAKYAPMSDIGMPADGSFPINMSGVHEATKVKIKNGKIILY